MIEKLETYINRNGFPIIRRCYNCKFWDNKFTDLEHIELAGYCRLKPIYFAPTLKPTVYPITKEFYLCEDHKFSKEEIMQEVCDKILMIDALKKKQEKK